MAASVIVDASFLVTLLHRGDSNHRWAADQALLSPPPWMTCEAALSEAEIAYWLNEFKEATEDRDWSELFQMPPNEG